MKGLDWNHRQVDASGIRIHYIRHFLDHWSHKPGLFDEDLGLWVENFMKSGNLQGGFDWYIGTNESRLDLIRNCPPDLPKVEMPTRVRWARATACSRSSGPSWPTVRSPTSPER